jgi:GWxTD domain-containing protein
MLLVTDLIANEDLPVRSSGELDFYIDHSIFRSGNDDIYKCEIYFMLYAGQIKGVYVEGERIGSIDIDLTIKNLESGDTKQHLWQTQIKMDQDSLRNRILAVYDQRVEYLNSGNYDFFVTIMDVNNQSEGKVELKLHLNDTKHNRQISQLQFVSHVEPNTKNDPFYKNGKTIYPNPSRRYGVLSPILYFYYEIYDLEKFIGDEINLNYSIISQIDSLNKSFLPKKINVPGESISIVHGLDVSHYPSGIYSLRVTANDANKNNIIQTERPFEIIQRDHLITSAKLSKDQLQFASNILTYFLSSRQLSFYNSLDISAKAQFLINFWSERDPSPNSKRNEYLEEIQNRYHYANKHYFWGKKEGWSTDKGRVLIVYGFPEETIRKHSDSETAPYEIWIYQEDRSYQFVFADINSTGNYILVHSTRENEIHNLQWQELVDKI